MSTVQIINEGEKKFVGVSVTAAFQNVRGIGETNRLFMERKNEIKNQVNSDKYVCLHFANDVMFTYIYSMEVSEIVNIPDGMIGFTIPSSKYAKIRSSDQEPYTLIENYISNNGMEKNSNLLSAEVFKFGEDESRFNADILVPIKG